MCWLGRVNVLIDTSRGKLSFLYLSLQWNRAVKKTIQLLPPLTSTQTRFTVSSLCLSSLVSARELSTSRVSPCLPRGDFDSYLITAAGNAISSQLCRCSPGKPVGTSRPSQYKSHLPGHSSPAQLGSVGNFSPAMGARIGTK